MNQTEILKNRQLTQATSLDKHKSTQSSNLSSAVTIIKANAYNENRDRTPKLQLPSKTNSSSKIIRVSSSKGINVYSVRPISSEKEVKEFNQGNNFSLGGSSETTIKVDESGVMGQMREELRKVCQRYEDKMNKELSYQHNFLTAEIDRLKELLAENDDRLVRQENELQQLLHRVETVQRKIDAKTQNMSRQLHQFKHFYNQCYSYTIKRISEAESSLKAMAQHIESQTSTVTHIETWKYVEYCNDLIKKIVAQCGLQSSSLKYYVDQELYALELGLGEFQDRYEEVQRIVQDMKGVKFGNQSLRDNVRELSKYQMSLNSGKKDQSRENFLDYYEPKFKEIIKRVNNSTIQIDLIKTLVKNQSETQSTSQSQKIQELTQTLATLERSLQQTKTRYTKELQEKEELLNRSNPRILELESQLHAYHELEAKMIKEISDLKLKVSYYQTKCEKNSERQYGIQSTMAEAFAETLVKEKTKKFMEEKELLQARIQALENRIKQLDRQNYLLAEKLSKSTQSIQQNIKLQAQLKFTTKLIHDLQQSQLSHEKQLEQYRTQIENQRKQNERMATCIEEEKKCSKRLAEKLEGLAKERNAVKEDDQQYFNELQEEVEGCYQKIQKLEKANLELVGKNKELTQKNLALEEDLHVYAETFEKQSITFRTALQNLQREKDFLGLQNKKISQQNRSLKLDIQASRTAQSFYENTSNLSLQLRKTVSTELPRFQSSTPTATQSKLQRKTLSSKERINKTLQLQNVLQKLKYELPVVCEIDATGYLKDQRTGCYFVDENEDYFELDQAELATAVKMGLILL